MINTMNDPKKNPVDANPTGSVPKVVVSRLSLYLRELQHLVRDGHETTNSKHLGQLLGVTAAQVRKDLAYFGQFGYPGIGYRCQELIVEFKRILGTSEPWGVALLGMGNLGRALLRYRGFASQGFRISAAFDVDEQLIGQTVEGIKVHSMAALPIKVPQLQIKLAMIAVPAVAAQEVADQAVESGIKGLLNFAPMTITLPDHVQSVGIDLAIELEQLSFAVVTHGRKT
jgi:redox-sensing transcriptional repressor